MGRKKARDQYDYENAFDKYVDGLGAAFVEEMMKNKVGLHYATKTIKSGKRFEVEIYPVFKRRGDVPPQRVKYSRKAQRSLNERNSKKKFIRLVEANFGEGDFWLTLTYDEGSHPETEGEAKRDIANYLKRVNRKRKRLGIGNAKYIYITEWGRGEEGGPRCHFHLIMEGGIGRDELEDMWKFAVIKDSSRLHPGEEGLGGLAAYMANKKRGKWERRWTPSKGLKQPVGRVSHSRAGKRQVERMVRDHEEIRGFFERNWRGCRFKEAEVMYNEFNCAFYIRIRARERSWGRNGKEEEAGAGGGSSLPSGGCGLGRAAGGAAEGGSRG